MNRNRTFCSKCAGINGIWAYRIRPLDAMGGGGHGDDILEIACSKKIPNVGPGAEVEIVLFPRD